MRRIYLDHTATTPVDPRVLEAMRPFFSGTFGNASSVHWYGQQARRALEASRETIAEALGASPGEVAFTSGGTESDNMALRSAAPRAELQRQIVTTGAEHHAVLDTCMAMEQEGYRVTVLPVTGDGSVDPALVAEAVSKPTALVSVMHANNEVGTVSPVSKIASIAHSAGALFHCDAVQSFGKIPVRVDDLGADLLAVSAHKIYGPKAIGALDIRKGTNVPPLLHGGGQERGRRPGTENVPLAVGFAEAVRIAVAGMEEEADRMRRLRDALGDEVRRTLPGVITNGDHRHGLPHLLSISFDSKEVSLDGEMLVVNMDLRGIAVSAGSACTSGSIQPSHVLLAMGRDMATARATLRFSFGRENSMDDVKETVSALRDAFAQMTS